MFTPLEQTGKISKYFRLKVAVKSIVSFQFLSAIIFLRNFKSKSTSLIHIKAHDEKNINNKWINPHFETIINWFKTKHHNVDLIGSSNRIRDIEPLTNTIGIISNVFSLLARIDNSKTKQISTQLERYFRNENIELELSKWVYNYVKIYLTNLKLWNKVFKNNKYSYLFSSEETATALCVAAKRNNVKVVELQHGAIDQFYLPYVWNANTPRIVCEGFLPDEILCFGELARTVILKTGAFSDKQVHAIGSYMLTYHTNAVKETNQDAFAILVALQPYMYGDCLELVKNINKLSLDKIKAIYIKPHPSQSDTEISNLKSCESSRLVTWVDKRVNIYEYLVKVGYVVSFTSTVLEEALALGKKVFTIKTAMFPMGYHSTITNQQIQSQMPTVDLDLIKMQNILNSSNSSENENEIDNFVSANNYEDNLHRFLESKV